MALKNKNISYEFYLNTNYGENVWHHDLHNWHDALEDFINNKNNKGFFFEIQITDEDGCEYVEIHPNDETHLLPMYVQKQVNKVLKRS
jgi:hypothetical protein